MTFSFFSMVCVFGERVVALHCNNQLQMLITLLVLAIVFLFGKKCLNKKEK